MSADSKSDIDNWCTLDIVFSVQSTCAFHHIWFISLLIWLRPLIFTEKPEPVSNLRAIETNPEYIVIAWDPPESDGGTPLLGYVVEKRDSKRHDYIYIADVEPMTTQYVC